MQVTEEQLQSFIELYKNEFNISISPVDAQQKALSLLRFLAISVIPFDLHKDDDRMEMSDLSK
jgi:uncharacterized protein YlxP (DUF503 family)